MYSSYADGSIAVHDIFLQPDAAMLFQRTAFEQCIVMPVFGSVIVQQGGTMTEIAPGQLYGPFRGSAYDIKLVNPLSEEAINCLIIGMNTIDQYTTPSISDIHLTAKDRLENASGFAKHIRVGVYGSRIKGRVPLQRSDGAIFAYVVNGSFEVEERLMEYRDGLLLWHVEQIEFQSLSEAAIILFIECSPLK